MKEKINRYYQCIMLPYFSLGAVYILWKLIQQLFIIGNHSMMEITRILGQELYHFFLLKRPEGLSVYDQSPVDFFLSILPALFWAFILDEVVGHFIQKKEIAVIIKIGIAIGLIFSSFYYLLPFGLSISGYFLIGVMALKPYFSDKKTVPGLSEIKEVLSDGRDQSVDVLRGFLMILVILGHIQIDDYFHSILYSVHMAAFIFLSGYFYHERLSLKNQIEKMLQSYMLPYFIYCVCRFMMQYDYFFEMGWKYTLKYFGLAFSYPGPWFSGMQSIGPIYFLILLFSIRCIYIALEKLIPQEIIRGIVILALSIIGMKIGQTGQWLPWSFDIALYALIYFYLGIMCFRYTVLEKCRAYLWIYVPLVLLWFHMIQGGSMELAFRHYEPYVFVILGAIAGTLVLYILFYGFSKYKVVAPLYYVMKKAGRYSLYILMVHSLIYDKFPRDIGIGVFFILICIQIVLGIFVGSLIQLLKKE